MAAPSDLVALASRIAGPVDWNPGSGSSDWHPVARIVARGRGLGRCRACRTKNVPVSRGRFVRRTVGCIYLSTTTERGIVASKLARHSGLDRAYFAEPAADQSGRRHPAA